MANKASRPVSSWVELIYVITIYLKSIQIIHFRYNISKLDLGLDGRSPLPKTRGPGFECSHRPFSRTFVNLMKRRK